MIRWIGRLTGLTLVAFVFCGCIPVTETAYPLLTYQKVRPAGKSAVAGRAAVGSSAMVLTESPYGQITPRYDAATGALQFGLTVGLGQRVDVDGDWLISKAGGVRAGARIRFTPDSSKVDMALQPAVVWMAAKDHQSNSPGSGEFEELQSDLTSYELRVPATLKVRKWLDVTAAAGISYTRYTSHYMTDHSGYPETRYARDWVSPILTLGCRARFITVEGGVHLMHDHWQPVIGLALGQW